MNNNLTLSVTLRGDGRQLTGTLRNAQGEVREFGDVSVRDNARATGAFERTERSVGTVNNQLNEMNRVGQLARNALLSIGGAISVREVIGYSDAWRNAENQLRQVTDTSTELAYIQGELVDIALETRSNFGASANLYARMARSTTELNLTQRELLALTTTINKSFATNGATAQEAAAAITQLSQGLAAGALRGDEYNSVAEQAPGITRAIAESLRMTIGELREFAAQGGITAEIVVNALQRSSDAIDQDFGKTVATFGQNMEIARTELVRWVGTSDEVSTAVDTLGGGIVTVTEHLDQLVTIAQVGAVLFAGRYVGAIAASQGALAAKTAVAATATGAINVLTGATTRQAAAATTMAAANRAGVAALALIGGSAGAAVIAGAGLYYFREELGLTDDKMKGTIDTVEDLGESFVDEFRNLGTSVMGGVRGARAELIELDAGFLDLKAGALESFTDIVAGSADLINMGLIPIQHALNALDQGFADWINRFANAFESAGAMPFGMANLFGEQVTRMRAMADGLTEGMIEPIGISTAALEGNAQAWRDQAEAMRGTADEVRSGTTPAAQETVAVFKTLDEWLFQTTKTTGDNTGANSKNAASQRELAAATQAQAAALEELYNRLRPGRREVVQLADDMRTLTLAIAMGTGNIAQNIQMMGLLQQQFIEAQNDTDDLAAKTVDAAFTMEGAWDEVRLNGLRRLDDGFTDLWEGAIDGSLNAGELMKKALAQTLAEMAHMAITRPITVQIATSMGFGDSGGAQQGGGFNLSSLKSGWDTVSGLWGGGSAASTAAAGYGAAGWAGSATGAYTGFAGNAAAGAAQAGGGLMGAASAAAPWLAGGMLIDNVLGLGIVDGIVSGISGLFSSSPTKFSGRFGTTASLDRSEGAGKDGVFEHQDSGRFYRETALGYAGFRDQGTERLQRAGVGEDKSWAEDLVNATAAMDALTVSVARSDQEIATMRDTVQGLEASGRNAGEIIEFALKGRALAALESIGHTFSDAVSSLPADEFTARLEIMAGGMGVLMQTADRLNLQFDATAAGALEAAGNLAQIAGGVDNLAAINQGYYQATYSETERLSRSQADLRASLAGVTDQVPTTVAELRNMVEAQNLNDAAAGELAVRLMELAPALKQTNDAVRQAIEEQYQESLGRAPDASGMDYWFNQVATGGATLERALSAIAASSEAAAFAAEDAAGSVDTMADALREREQLERQLLTLEGNTAELRRRDLEVTDESNRALQQRIWAVQDEQERLRNLERQQQERVRTIQQEASAMARAREQLASFGVSITSYVDNLRSTDAGLGSPADQLAASSQAFYEQYDKAASGDRDAMNSITQYADRFIEAQQGWSASGSQTTATIDKVVGMLESLPEQLSPEQFLADEFRGIITDQTETLGDVFGSGFSNAITSLSQNFDQLDTNLNGLLTYDEIKRALGDKATDAQVAVLIAAVDTNGDGMISRQELTNARLGGLAKGVASSLEGSFDLLDTSLDGLLTYSELRQGLGGLATDAQVKAMMRSMDLNADGVISQLESVVIASMPTDAVLGTVLRNKMTEVGSRQLTHSQVRNALSPIATDAEISRLIREVDVNGDGMISQQELTNSRLGGLSRGIANAVAGEFDRIDISDDGLIDYNEFRNVFAGMATDSELRRIFNQLDATRTGTISRLDAQTNELVTAAKSTDLSEQEQSIVRALNAQQNSDTVRWWGWNFANEFQRKFKPSVGEGIGVSLAPAQNGTGARSIATAFKQILGANTNGSHATGLGYVPFDGYIAELHRGEMVVTADHAAMLREFVGTSSATMPSVPPMPAPRGLPAPTLPAFPLLDKSDQTQLLRDVLNENKQLRADINKLMSGTNKHLAAANTQRGAAAKGQIGAIERGNKMLKKLEDDKRLEAAKR